MKQKNITTKAKRHIHASKNPKIQETSRDFKPSGGKPHTANKTGARHNNPSATANKPSPQRGAPSRSAAGKPLQKYTDGRYWLYGTHAVQAALKNPDRRLHRCLLSENQQAQLEQNNIKIPKFLTPEILPTRDIDAILGEATAHQGIAVLVSPLESPALEDLLEENNYSDETVKNAPFLVLDQVTDPHNVGAILRSCAAFGVRGIITPKDHAARETGAMAKSACGALDIVPLIEVTNLARALDLLKKSGYWLIGLDGAAKAELATQAHLAPAVLVLGAEGKGLRRLSAEACDVLAKLPMDTRMESLNVSNAAAIALYQLYIGKNQS